VFRADGDSLLARVISLAYPVADVVIVSIVVFSATRSDTREPARLQLVALGLCAIALSDSAFAYLTQTNNYLGSQLSDVGWVAGFLVIALAAALPVPARRQWSSTRVARGALVVPYLPILAAGGVAVVRMIDGDGLDAFLVWTGIVAIVLLCVHQIVVLNENHGLTVGLIWWSFGMILALAYFVFIYRMFRGKVSLEEQGY